MHDCRVEFIRPNLSIQLVIGRMNSALQMAKPININLLEYQYHLLYIDFDLAQ
ncbi:hypothetical protein MNBD_GAMMA13-870 [hydrothermal vent metagenome]|uniref:Uncharacterized protein n=1 Tax=hydrothermal vent metagenome TaxID=652676 RepID=A0A3B0Y5B3_9ZZZZ